MCRPSGTSAMPRLSTASGTSPVRASPSKTTEPCWGLRAPASARSKVVLPAPFGPSAATISPGATSSDTSRTATTAP